MKIHYPNQDDWQEHFWKNNYRFSITSQSIQFHVNADCEQSAIDYIIDYCRDNNMPGIVASYQELLEDDYSETEISEYICGGNEGLFLTTHNIHIAKI